MSGHVLQYVWPVTDDSYTRTELIEEATDQLDRIAERHHAIITGPPIWLIADAAQVPGWQAWAGAVLIMRAPAEPVERYRAWRISTDVDHAKVERAVLEGEFTARQLGTAEKVAVVTTLVDRGLNDREIGAHLSWSNGRKRAGTAVTKFRSNHAIPAARAA